MNHQRLSRSASILGLSALIAATSVGAGAQVINDSGISYSPPADITFADFGYDLANSFGRLAIGAPGVNNGFPGKVVIYDTTTEARLHRSRRRLGRRVSICSADRL